MKQIFLLFTLPFLLLIASCGSETNCKDSDCVNGSCVNDACKCDEGWKGEFCDEEKTPESIKVSNIKIVKFPETDGGKPWDDEDDDSKADVSVKVYDLSKNYFTPSDITSSVLEDADGDSGFNVKTNFKIRDMESDITFQVVDYDVDDNFEVEWEFIGSSKVAMKDLYSNFPDKITISSTSGKTELELTVSYTW